MFFFFLRDMVKLTRGNRSPGVELVPVVAQIDTLLVEHDLHWPTESTRDASLVCSSFIDHRSRLKLGIEERVLGLKRRRHVT